MGRLFNVHTAGSRQMFTHFIREGLEEELFRRCQAFIASGTPRYDFAILYPISTHVMEPRYYTTVDRTFFYRVRECVDYGFVDERMATEGGLEPYKALLVYETSIAPAEILGHVSNWVSSGGILVAINSRVGDYDGDTSTWDDVVGFTERSDVVSGGHSMDLLEPDVLPSFEGLQCEPKNGASFLAPDCTVLLRMGGDNVGRLAWMRRHGEGWVFAYHGPPNSHESPGLPHKGNYRPPPPGCETEKPASYPVLFFRDVLRHIAAHKTTYGPDLNSLWLGDEPVFLAEMEGGHLVAMNVGEKDAQLERFGETHVVPAQSIVRVPSGD
jgi:hypothetical protein